nr:hypothetical protein GCM10020093_111980 [Planobispora longispora]
MTTVRLNPTDNVVSFDTDALVVGVHSGPDGLRAAPGAEGLDQALGGKLAATLNAMGVKGKAGETAKVPTFGALAALLLVVGLGDAPEGDYDAEPSVAPQASRPAPWPGPPASRSPCPPPPRSRPAPSRWAACSAPTPSPPTGPASSPPRWPSWPC